MSESQGRAFTPAPPDRRVTPRPATLMDDMGSPAIHQMRVIARRRNEAEAKLEQHFSRAQGGSSNQVTAASAGICPLPVVPAAQPAMLVRPGSPNEPG